MRPVAKRLIFGTATYTEVIFRVLGEVHFCRFVVGNDGVIHIFSHWVLKLRLGSVDRDATIQAEGLESMLIEAIPDTCQLSAL